jgi:hypothetical protein
VAELRRGVPVAAAALVTPAATDISVTDGVGVPDVVGLPGHVMMFEMLAACAASIVARQGSGESVTG